MTELIVTFLNFANASNSNLASFPHRGSPCNLSRARIYISLITYVITAKESNIQFATRSLDV